MASENKELSLYATVLIVFITHDFVNAALLSPWNPLRCTYWNLHQCTIDQHWIMNWLAQGRFHAMMLFAFLTRAAIGNVIQEQRMAQLAATMMVTYLTSGVFLLADSNKPMAALQGGIYATLLAVLAFHSAASKPATSPPAELRSSSLDLRRKISISTICVGIHATLATLRALDMLFGKAADTYLGDDSGAIYQLISKASLTEMVWQALLLVWAMFFCTVDQQKSLMMGQTVALFVLHVILSGPQGERIEAESIRIGLFVNFLSLLIAILGSF